MSATQSCTKFNGYLLTGPSATRPRTTILRDSSVFTPCLQFRQQISGNPVNVGNVVNVSEIEKGKQKREPVSSSRLL